MRATKKLETLRKRIDRIDAVMVPLLNARTRTTVEVGNLKKKHGMEAYVPNREKEVLDRVRKLNEGPLPDCSVRAIYREIMSASLSLETNIRVAYLGPKATFTHEAARSQFGASVIYLPRDSIGDIFDAVEKRQADYAVVPVENSTEGAVTVTLDMLVSTTLKICGEIYLPVSLCLMARCPRSRIKLVYSHPHVIGQCRQWLAKEMPGIETVPTTSTARAAELASNEKSAGALAGALAAELYGLNVLASGVQDMSDNVTRFLVIGRTSSMRTGDDKTSMVFSVKHRAGALCEALERLKKYGLNMTKIESRPSRFKAWQYHFFVDIEGHADDKRVRKALGEVSDHCTLMKILGSYPKAQQ